MTCYSSLPPPPPPVPSPPPAPAAASPPPGPASALPPSLHRPTPIDVSPYFQYPLASLKPGDAVGSSIPYRLAKDFGGSARTDFMPFLIAEIRQESRNAKFRTSLTRSTVPDRGHGVLSLLAKSPATIPVPLITCSVDEALAVLSREQPLLSRLLIPLLPSDNRLKRERQRRKSFPPSAAEGASSSMSTRGKKARADGDEKT